jgi:hypothetical protein
MNTKPYISLTCGRKKQIAKQKSSKKVGMLTFETMMKRPDRAFLSPEMVMQDINSCTNIIEKIEKTYHKINSD